MNNRSNIMKYVPVNQTNVKKPAEGSMKIGW